MLGTGAAVDVGDAAGRSPLYLAARAGHLDVVRFLVEHGATVNSHENRTGFTPLHVAAQENHPDVILFLLAHGADPNARNLRGQTPLWQASWQTWHRNDVVVKMLIDHGADPNDADVDGYMPLHIAAEHGNAHAVQALLNAGADINATCQWRTAISIAEANQQSEVVALLRERGALEFDERQLELLKSRMAQPHKPRSQPQRVFDEAQIIRGAPFGNFEDYLYWIFTESDIDIRFVFVRDLRGLSIEEYAAKKLTELGIGGRGREERGVLLVYNLAGKELRIEVGYGLEDVFPDAFVAYLIREHAQTFFESGDTREGLMLMMRILQDRIRQAVLGRRFDPTVLDLIQKHALLSGGAGASRQMVLKSDPNAYFRSKLNAEQRRHFSAQPTVEKAYQRYLEWLEGGQFDPDIELFTPDTRARLVQFPMSRAYFEWILSTEYGRHYKILERGGLAMQYFTDDPTSAPGLYRKTADGWQMDIHSGIPLVRSMHGGPYTWQWVGKDDEYTRAFKDRFVRIGGYRRVVDGDNRPLPIRGATW